MSKTCVLAQHGLSVDTNGTLTPCCQFREKSHNGGPTYTFRKYPQWRIEMDKLAADLDKGIEDPRCFQCWHDEKLGYASLRTDSNQRHSNLIVKSKRPGAFFEKNTPLWHIEFKLGNFCNLQCIMCSPYSSSSIWTEFAQNTTQYNAVGIKWDPPVMEHKWWETLEFKKFYTNALSTATYLHFSGGEPFMVPGLVDILSSVPDPKTVDLLFVTNMTMLNDKALPLIETFKSVSFAVSLEGVGHHNDYVRYGSDFATIEKNLLRVKELVPNQTWMSINHTFQHTSIYSLPALIDWCCAHGFLLHFSLHGGEEYMKINSVPPSDMAQFKTWVEQSTTITQLDQNYLLSVIKDYCYSPELNVEFQQYVNMLDSIRGNNYNLTFNPANSS